ncbi:MAG: hypothetical protein GC168_02565 [Candidatus Hydrogenedens sp.]|nr:hypothetical protein [Candidatus Hydrogenedens sp.]
MRGGAGVNYQVGSISRSTFDLARFVAYANAQQSAVTFVDALRQRMPRLIFTDQAYAELVEVQPGAIMLPLVDSSRLSQYAKIEMDEYLLSLAMAGIVMHQTLRKHKDFLVEDLLHRHDPSCIFSRGLPPEQRLVMLEHLYVCPGCHTFYQALQLGELCEAAHEVVRRVDDLRMARSVRRRLKQKS